MSPRVILLGLFATLLILAPAHAQTTPADLVPADATGFVHVPLAEFARNDLVKLYGNILKESGEALRIFESRVVPSITSLDRLTAYFRVIDPKAPPTFVIILTTTKDIDPVLFVRQWLPDAREENVGKGRIYFSERNDIAVRFHNPRTIFIGPMAAIRSESAKAIVREGPLAPALKKATGSTAVAAMDPSFVPAEARGQVPPPFQPLLKMKLVVASMDMAKPGRIDVRLSFPTAGDAEDGEKALRFAANMGRQAMVGPREQMMAKIRGEGPIPLDKLPEAAAAVMAVGAIEKADKILAAPPLTRKGGDVDIALDIPPGLESYQMTIPVMMALMVPAVQKVREAATRTQKNNNLRQLALANNNYYGVNKGFPSAAICNKAGKPLLSWRVAILPFIEQEALYKKFKLDEPWDSEHNKKLIPLMPSTYEHPDSPNRKNGETHFRVFFGGGALFDLDVKTRIQQVTDGTSNTLMIVEAAESVPWTAPHELPYDPKLRLPELGLPGAQRASVALVDGSVRTMRLNLPEATLRALITRAGGELMSGKELDD